MPKGLHDLLGSPIAFRPEFVKITGDACAALFLSQCFYWSEIHSERGGWFYKTATEWEAETGLTRREREHARRLLVELKVLEERRGGKDSGENGVLNYRVATEQIEHLLSTKPECTKRTNRNVQNEHTDEPGLHKTYKPECTKRTNRNVQNEQSPYMESETSKKTSTESVVQRATRLPHNWVLPDEWRAASLAKLRDTRPWVDIDMEAEKFRNYWTAKPGRDATKLDWFRTWMNWLFNVKPPPGYQRAGPPDSNGRRGSSLEERAMAIQRQIDERDAQRCK